MDILIFAHELCLVASSHLHRHHLRPTDTTIAIARSDSIPRDTILFLAVLKEVISTQLFCSSRCHTTSKTHKKSGMIYKCSMILIENKKTLSIVTGYIHITPSEGLLR